MMAETLGGAGPGPIFNAEAAYSGIWKPVPKKVKNFKLCIILQNNQDIQGLTPGEVQHSKILLEGVTDFIILHLLRCLTLFLTPFYRVNVCLLFV